ncbi:hypothetical protein [Nesterenkonia pannonica]|uniref:metallophosphoesterase n=1 Tax=Nesterenkonia pannonica TaxID=1548602 RepID=UPI0021648B79|nr:metallophosphoesterase [Nesterenkonia pannonica]
MPGQRKAFEWLRQLADLEPDLVINTGDNLSHPDAVDEVLDALAALRQFPGAFVPGSNDYFAPQLKNPSNTCAAPPSPTRSTGSPPWTPQPCTGASKAPAGPT